MCYVPLFRHSGLRVPVESQVSLEVGREARVTVMPIKCKDPTMNTRVTVKSKFFNQKKVFFIDCKLI